MDYGYFSLILIIAVGSLLSKEALLALCIPLFMISSWSGLVPPLVSIGDADVQVFDFLLLIVALRVISPVALHRRDVPGHPVFLIVALFLIWLLVATLLAYYRFGEEVFKGEIISLLRFLVQVSVLFFIANSIRISEQLDRLQNYIEWFGTIVSTSIYVAVVLFTFGIKVGEVQATEDTVRYFGIVGDQVGFLLLLFIFKAIIERNLLKLIFYTEAFLVTGTRGSLITLIIGLLLILKIRFRIVKWLGPVIALVVFIGFAIWWNVAGFQQRFIGPALEFGLTQRLLTYKLALDVFLNNFLIGVGFTGFRFVALEYGAVEIFASKIGFAPNYIATAGMQWLQTATDGGLPAVIGLGWLGVVLSRTLRFAAVRVGGKWKSMYLAGHIWLVSLLIGNLTAAWMLPGSLISYTLWLISGSAIAIELMEAKGLARKRAYG